MRLIKWFLLVLASLTFESCMTRPTAELLPTTRVVQSKRYPQNGPTRIAGFDYSASGYRSIDQFVLIDEDRMLLLGRDSKGDQVLAIASPGRQTNEVLKVFTHPEIENVDRKSIFVEEFAAGHGVLGLAYRHERAGLHECDSTTFLELWLAAPNSSYKYLCKSEIGTADYRARNPEDKADAYEYMSVSSPGKSPGKITTTRVGCLRGDDSEPIIFLWRRDYLSRKKKPPFSGSMERGFYISHQQLFILQSEQAGGTWRPVPTGKWPFDNHGEALWSRLQPGTTEPVPGFIP